MLREIGKFCVSKRTGRTSRREETPLISQSARDLEQPNVSMDCQKIQGGRRGTAEHDERATGRPTLDAGARLRKLRELMMAEERTETLETRPEKRLKERRGAGRGVSSGRSESKRLGGIFQSWTFFCLQVMRARTRAKKPSSRLT